MLSTRDILRILEGAARILKISADAQALEEIGRHQIHYNDHEFDEFQRDLVESANKTRLLFLKYVIPFQAVDDFIRTNTLVVAFASAEQGIHPVLIEGKTKKSKFTVLGADDIEVEGRPLLLQNPEGSVVVFAVFGYQAMVSNSVSGEPSRYLKPVARFFGLLSAEKREIFYVLLYGIIIGLTSLALPLGIQTTVELISGGVFFSSVYVLIALVILGVVFTGVLQIVQISVVEHLQRRIFTKAAFEFAFRIPRLKLDALSDAYAPELVNRFFDIMTLQKGLPKFLTDLSAAAIQIFFGLLLLSLYHPFFVFFSLFLLGVLVIIFVVTGPRGLASSLEESKYKYKLVYWLEELARSINSFKLAGNTDLPITRTDYNVNSYLKYRKAHFSVLMSQYSFIVMFKALVTGGLLIVGTLLVVQREITLGQFVASEIIIILILNAVEKVIMYMEVVYDLLTAVDKIGSVTDLPLDRLGGVDLAVHSATAPYRVEIQNLRYRYPNRPHYVLNGVNLSINEGEKICLSGPEGSGKSTLTRLIAGLSENYEGALTINGFSMHDLDLLNMKNRIAKNISQDDIFDGTLLDNITLGKQSRTSFDAIAAIEKAGLSPFVNQLPDGLNTHILSGGKGFSNTVLHRLILARCFAKQPGLLILNDFFSGLRRSEKLDLINRVTGIDSRWTLIAESNDPLIMAACDRVIVMNGGVVVAEGRYDDLIKDESVRQYFH